MIRDPRSPRGPGSGPDAASPFAPNATLWEQWYDHYASRSLDELQAEEELLLADAGRLAQMFVPDPEALDMVGLRLALIDEFLAAAAR